MNYIIVDFEWNQPTIQQPFVNTPFALEAEIVEIGAIKLNDEFKYIDEFKSFVKPTFLLQMSSKVLSLTKIRPQLLRSAKIFPEVCAEFLNWCGEKYCFCTWGSNDIPVLLDNMLIHGMAAPDLVYTCDLQQIYSREIMNDSYSRWGLERAIDLLNLPKHRAHDALNDAKNTFAVCCRVDIPAYIDEYAFSLVNYGNDRLNGVRLYSDFSNARNDTTFISVTCPHCGETVILHDWTDPINNEFFGYGKCSELSEFLGKYHYRRKKKYEIEISRMTFEMSNVLWDEYQDAVENKGCA